jgi:hypothetical protein
VFLSTSSTNTEVTTSQCAVPYSEVLLDKSVRSRSHKYFPDGIFGFVSDHVYPSPEPVISVLESDNLYSLTTFSTDTPYGPVAPGVPSLPSLITDIVN